MVVATTAAVISAVFKVGAATKARKRRRKQKRARRTAFALRQQQIAETLKGLDLQLEDLGVKRLRALMASRESAAAKGFAKTPFETGISEEIEDAFNRAEKKILLDKEQVRLGGDIMQVQHNASRYQQPDFAEQLFSSFGPSDFSFLNTVKPESAITPTVNIGPTPEQQEQFTSTGGF